MKARARRVISGQSPAATRRAVRRSNRRTPHAPRRRGKQPRCPRRRHPRRPAVRPETGRPDPAGSRGRRRARGRSSPRRRRGPAPARPPSERGRRARPAPGRRRRLGHFRAAAGGDEVPGPASISSSACAPVITVPAPMPSPSSATARRRCAASPGVVRVNSIQRMPPARRAAHNAAASGISGARTTAITRSFDSWERKSAVMGGSSPSVGPDALGPDGVRPGSVGPGSRCCTAFSSAWCRGGPRVVVQSEAPVGLRARRHDGNVVPGPQRGGGSQMAEAQP